MSQKLLKPAEAAERLGVSRRQVYYLIERGDLPSVIVGERRICVSEADLEEYIENNRREDYAFIR